MFEKLQAVGVFVGAVVLAGQCCGKAPVNSGTTYARDLLAPYVKSGQLPGFISVFYKDGKQETCCLGYADVAARRKISMDDVFMQCSQTKGFCGVTVAKLIEDGKLRLDDPVSKYLPEFGTLWIRAGESNGVRRLVKAKNKLTLRMCLNHTGGFSFEDVIKQPHLRGGGWSGGACLRINALVAAVCPIRFDPGTSVQYSNTGIDIAAAVVEVVTGMKWEEYLKQEVLDPLGMKDTVFWPTDAQLDRKIELYNCVSNAPAKWCRESGWMQRPYNGRNVLVSAAAGLWTTANDQLKFYKMLMNLGVGDNGVRILQGKTVRELLAVSTRPRKFGGYSLGLVAPVVDGEDQWFGHGGAWGTKCMVNWHRRELKLWVVQLLGDAPKPWDAVRDEAADRFFQMRIDNSDVNSYTGRTR